jgi:hypothetical protein
MLCVEPADLLMIGIGPTRIQGRQIDSGVIAKFEFHDLYSEGQLVIDLIGYKFGTTLL